MSRSVLVSDIFLYVIVDNFNSLHVIYFLITCIYANKIIISSFLKQVFKTYFYPILNILCNMIINHTKSCRQTLHPLRITVMKSFHARFFYGSTKEANYVQKRNVKNVNLKLDSRRTYTFENNFRWSSRDHTTTNQQ